MKFSPEVLAGLDPGLARKALKFLTRIDHGGEGTTVDEEAFRRATGCKFRSITQTLIPLGFIRKDGGRYAGTDLGVRLVKAQILPRISRAKLEVLLTNFVARTVEADQDARFLYRFETIAVFGSYLRRDEHDFGDLDLAVSTGLKPEFGSLDDDLLKRRHLSHFPADERCHWRWGPKNGSFASQKGGKRRLDFIRFDELLEMGSRYAIVRKAP